MLRDKGVRMVLSKSTATRVMEWRKSLSRLASWGPPAVGDSDHSIALTQNAEPAMAHCLLSGSGVTNMTNQSRTLYLATFLSAISAFAQPVSIGVKGGVPITDALETARGNNAAYFTNTHRYVVGPTIEFHFPARFSLEIDALYRRLSFDFSSTAPPPPTFTATRANSWEFPVLGKFEITPGPVRPFVDAGVSIRHITGIKQVRQVISGTTLGTVEVNNPPQFNRETDVGFVFGGGVTFKLWRVRISPELRYTRWGSENFRDPVGSLLRTNRNQGDFLLGFTF